MPSGRFQLLLLMNLVVLDWMLIKQRFFSKSEKCLELKRFLDKHFITEIRLKYALGQGSKTADWLKDIT